MKYISSILLLLFTVFATVISVSFLANYNFKTTTFSIEYGFENSKIYSNKNDAIINNGK
jgi:hypothetical protein